MVYGPTPSDPVGGDHGDFLAALAIFLKPWRYLELGVADGATFAKVARTSEKWGCACTGVDRTPTCNGVPGTIVTADTVEFMKAQPDDFFDLIFLDSSHEFEATMRELTEIERVLAPNGVLAMHDTYPPNESEEDPGRCGGAWKAAAALRYRSVLETMTLPAQYGITLARKSNGNQLLWKP